MGKGRVVGGDKGYGQEEERVRENYGTRGGNGMPDGRGK
ncbi:hypothetical protein E2C01_083326 [Portunus trituberculatus]|uniref:Uncharacterized protein n=1 Tax=Portunus trituberculatus TaxID=210409 RepID=A0A5B7J7J0_PORTR|nr:hypothetical protein [Portunus trituberculatus]